MSPEFPAGVLRQLYSTTAPNEAIPLHRGPLQFEQNGRSWKGEGEIRHRWLPSPAIYFSIPGAEPSQVPPHIGAGRLLVRDRGFGFGAAVSSLNQRGGTDGISLSMRGRSTEVATVSPTASIQKLFFHLPNFHAYISPRTAQSGPNYSVRQTVFSACR